MTDHIEIARRALIRIAADNELTQNGSRKKLSRFSAISIAREACLALGWDFGKEGRAAAFARDDADLLPQSSE